MIHTMKVVYIIFVSCLCVVFSCSINRLTRKGVYKEVEPETFLTYVNDSTVNIIDVRTPSEYEKSHIKGAVNASYFGGDFKKTIDSLGLDTSRTTLIYCETQHRSLFATKILYKRGFKKIVDLKKGMMNWRKLAFPYISAAE